MTSVLAWREWQKPDFGVPGKSRDAPGNVCKKGGKFKFWVVQYTGVVGMARIGFRHGGDGMTSVLAWREVRKQDFGVLGMSRDAPGTLHKKGGKFKFSTVWYKGIVEMARKGSWPPLRPEGGLGGSSPPPPF